MPVKCLICGIEKEHSIVEHIKYVHKINSKTYREIYPNSDIKSKEYLDNLKIKVKEKWSDLKHKEKMIKIRNMTHKNPEYRKKMSEKIKKIHKENPNVFSGFTKWSSTEKFKKWIKSDERIKKISESSKKRWENIEYREKTINSLKKVLNDGRCIKNEEYRKKMSEKISQLYSEGLIKNEKNKYKTGIYTSKSGDTFIYSSSYELESMEFFDSFDGIIKWTNKHGIRIKYYFNNLNRHYIPDFFVELSNGKTYIIEMKGWETDEVLIKKHYAQKEYPNYKIFYSVEDLKNFIYENVKNKKNRKKN